MPAADILLTPPRIRIEWLGNHEPTRTKPSGSGVEMIPRPAPLLLPPNGLSLGFDFADQHSRVDHPSVRLPMEPNHPVEESATRKSARLYLWDEFL